MALASSERRLVREGIVRVLRDLSGEDDRAAALACELAAALEACKDAKAASMRSSQAEQAALRELDAAVQVQSALTVRLGAVSAENAALRERVRDAEGLSSRLAKNAGVTSNSQRELDLIVVERDDAVAQRQALLDALSRKDEQVRVSAVGSLRVSVAALARLAASNSHRWC